MALTREQIVKNIEAMDSQGASQEDIQMYINNLEQPQTEAKTRSALSSFATGIAKKEIGLVKGMGSLLQGAGQRMMAAISPSKSLEDVRKTTGIKAIQKGTPEEALFAEAIEPVGFAEKAGGVVADVATFALPGGAITKAGKVAETAFGATKLGRVAGFGAKVATEAAGFGTITAAQEGEFGQASRDAAVISALFPVIGKAGSTIKALASGKMTKIKADTAKRLVNSLIKPSLRVESYGKNPGLRVAQEGITANSLEDLAQKISTRRSAIFTQMEKVANKSTKMTNLSGVLAPIDDAIIKAQKTPRVNATLISRLNDIKSDLLGSIDDFGKVAVKDSVAFKRTIGDITKFTGNASDDSLVNKPLKSIYGKVKDAINKQEPALKKLNERYADLTSAEIATKHRDIIAGRQNILGLTTGGLGTGAALTTAVATGGALTPALLVGAGVAGLKEAMATPTVKTRVASYLANLSTQEKKVLIEKAPWIKGVILEMYLGVKD